MVYNYVNFINIYINIYKIYKKFMFLLVKILIIIYEIKKKKIVIIILFIYYSLFIHFSSYK